MEYGLWNFHSGFWSGGNGGFPPVEGITRNFYTAVNNEIEPPTFHVTTPGNGNSQNLFSAPSGPQPCSTTIRTNLEFLSMKHANPVNGRVPPMIMPGHHDDLLQSVALENVPMASEMMTEQNSMDSLAPTDSSMPPLLSHQQNHYSNNSNNNSSSSSSRNSHHHQHHNSQNNNSHLATTTNCNNNINNNNNSKDREEENDDDHVDNNPSDMSNEGKTKLRRRDDEIWEDISGTNIKLENNTDIDYLFHQSYQHPMYGMVFSRMSSNKREAVGISEETDEEDEEELEESGPQIGTIDNSQSTSPPEQNGSPSLQSVSNPTPVTFSKNGYECGECGLVAETRPGLKKHIAVFHPSPNLNSFFLRKMSTSSKCPMSSCRFKSSEKTEMEAHMARHVAGDYKLNARKRAGPLTPQRVRYEREEYRCQICAYSCTVEKAFHKHLKIHSVGRQMNQIKISCVICGKDRSSEVDMNKHMKKHRDDRYFCCDICIFKTVQLKKLIQHRRMHTGEKPHLCPHCSYRSARRDNLRSHVRRVHKKDNLFCDTFSPRGLLITDNSANSLAVPATPIPPGTLASHLPAMAE